MRGQLGPGGGGVCSNRCPCEGIIRLRGIIRLVAGVISVGEAARLGGRLVLVGFCKGGGGRPRRAIASPVRAVRPRGVLSLSV